MRVKNFAGFMKNRLNESEGMMNDYSSNPEEDMTAGYYGYGANPEDEEEETEGEGEGEETEELSLESLKAMIDDLTERIEKLEPEEEEEGEGEEGEGEEGEEAEGEAAPAE